MHHSEFNPSRTRRPPSMIDLSSNTNPLDANRLSVWYENIEEYEGNLEEIASATLDQTFQDEMQHVNQWFEYLSEAEKTATIYTLLQNSTQVQVRFFMHLLQEKSNPKSVNRASERASNLMNLNSRRGGSSQTAQSRPLQNQQNQQNSQNPQNRHSFALGDTEELSRLFGRMGADWFNTDDIQQQQRVNVPRASSNLRPKSVMELSNNGGGLDSSFPTSSSNNSYSWLQPQSQQQRPPGPPGLFSADKKSNVIERPRSADISNWNIPTSTGSSNNNSGHLSWQPLSNQHHDIDFNWKNNRNSAIIQEEDTPTDSRRASITNMLRYSQLPPSQQQQHFTSDIRPSSIDLENTIMGYPSDQTGPSLATGYRRLSLTANTSSLANHISGNMAIPTIIEPSVGSNNKDDQQINMELLKDVTAWFRTLRLHKYNSVFENMQWQDIVKMDDEALQQKGVAALGARRKMLKVFENVRDHCKANNIEY